MELAKINSEIDQGETMRELDMDRWDSVAERSDSIHFRKYREDWSQTGQSEYELKRVCPKASTNLASSDKSHLFPTLGLKFAVHGLLPALSPPSWGIGASTQIEWAELPQ